MPPFLPSTLLVAVTLAAGSAIAAEPAAETAPGPALAAVAEPSPEMAATLRTLCGLREPCRVAMVSAAGGGAGGARLTVVELALPAPDPEAGGPPATAPEVREPECHPYRREFWLLQDGAGALPPRLVLTLCNDGYGAAGVGEDEVTVGDNRLVHTQSGGSNWRWSRTRTVRLSPLTVLGEQWDGWWTVGLANVEAGRWDWTRFAGRVEWSAPACGPDGQPPELDEDAERVPGEVRPDYAYVPIPMMAAETLPEGAGGAALGSCAVQVDARDGDGFVIHGDAAGASAGEWMRLLLIDQPRTLLVSVRTDGEWRSGASNWIHDDHLELWLGPMASYYSHCLDSADRPRQWGIRITDGTVFDAWGQPDDRPRVESRQQRADTGPSGAGSIVTFRLALPEGDESDNITVVLSRGDGAHHQERLIATSRLRAGDGATLGRSFFVAADAAHCAVRDGRLDLIDSGLPAILGADSGD